MSSTSAIQWRRRHDWDKIDPQILLCFFARTTEERLQMFERLQVRYRVPHSTLVNRSRYIGARSITALDGPAAIKHYGQSMRGLIRTYKLHERLFRALGGQMRSLRKEHQALMERGVDFKYIARLLHIRVEIVRAIVVDLQLLPQDEHGKIPLPELRKFLGDPANLVLFASWKLARMRKAFGIDTREGSEQVAARISRLI